MKVLLQMSNVVFAPTNTLSWLHKLTRLLLVTTFCLAGLASAQDNAKFDSYSHKASISTTLPSTIVAETSQHWDPGTTTSLNLVINPMVGSWLPVISQTAAHSQLPVVFFARAPPASSLSLV